MTLFPFPHQVRIEARITDTTLTIATTVRATGDAPVPISFGYHPYFRLPGVERSAWSGRDTGERAGGARLRGAPDR